MKEKILLRLIIGIVLIIIILSIVLLWSNMAIKQTELNEIVNDIEAGENKEDINIETILSCLQFYLEYCQNWQEDIYEETLTEEEKLTYIYDMLDKQYILDNDITIETIKSKVKIYNTEVSFKVNQIKKENNTTNISYVLYGEIEKTENLEKIEDACYILNIDIFNKTFSIVPIFITDKFDINNVDTKKYDKLIAVNNNNSYNYVELTSYQFTQNCFMDFIKRMIFQPEEAYSYLDESYRKLRFPTIDSFNSYILSMQNYLNNIQIINYKDLEEQNSKYQCEDQYGNIYLFKREGINGYTVMLDDYTIENVVFDQKYKNADELDKVILNIDKFFKMINMQDYTSAYEVLDATFKQNYFSTQQQFEEYMKGKFFRYNNVVYNSYVEPVTNLYSFNLTVSDKAEEKQETIDFNVIMQLLDGTDFVMSFEVE